MSVDLVVVGLGSAGRTAVELAAALGAKVVAVERGRPGGDCLWSGCVPSKALLAAGRAAHTMRTAARFGIAPVEPEVDLAAAWRRIRAVQEVIAAGDDDPQRLRALGVEVVQGSARLATPNEVVVAGRRIETRFVLLATGSRPLAPPIPGLAAAAPLDTDDLFTVEAPPTSLVVLGGGPVGVELAQGLRRLGIRITLLEQAGQLLPGEDPDLVAVLTRVLEGEGIEVRCGAAVERVTVEADGIRVVHTATGALRAAGVLVAAGRQPNVEGLGLDAVGADVGPCGVLVDSTGRTSASTVFAAGDVVGGRHLTPWAASAASLAVRTMLLPGGGKAEDVVPWSVFTDPELAGVGWSPAEAVEHLGDEAVVWRRSGGDRSHIDDVPQEVVAVTDRHGRLVGARVLGPAASEVIHELALALRDGRRLTHLAGLAHVYPTQAAVVGALAADVSLERARRIGARRRPVRLPPMIDPASDGA